MTIRGIVFYILGFIRIHIRITYLQININFVRFNHNKKKKFQERLK